MSTYKDKIQTAGQSAHCCSEIWSSCWCTDVNRPMLLLLNVNAGVSQVLPARESAPSPALVLPLTSSPCTSPRSEANLASSSGRSTTPSSSTTATSPRQQETTPSTAAASCPVSARSRLADLSLCHCVFLCMCLCSCLSPCFCVCLCLLACPEWSGSDWHTSRPSQQGSVFVLFFTGWDFLTHRSDSSSQPSRLLETSRSTSRPSLAQTTNPARYNTRTQAQIQTQT